MIVWSSRSRIAGGGRGQSPLGSALTGTDFSYVGNGTEKAKLDSKKRTHCHAPGVLSRGRNDENIAKTKRLIDEDCRKTIDEVSEQTNLSWSTVQRMLTEDLHMRRVSAKFVPRLLTDDQRENRVRVFRDLKSEVQNDQIFLKELRLEMSLGSKIFNLL
ncbi:hypothetical protein ANN_07553 [Periplaneta americana]|uniref:Uncharacterized protein n=1 Tax=Periplaneta americana TaxID=6978 RepID=A0ABQ8T039_PERAM|nr:hypothetical protein ANN_07553 [Periplaneta americana]